MKIRVIFDLDERTRLAIARFYGLRSKNGRIRPATRKECRGWIEGMLYADLETIVAEHDERCAEEGPRKS